MKGWRFLSGKEKKKDVKHEMILRIDSRIRLCSLTREELIFIREHPDVLKIFSPEEIIEFNQAEREIPKVSQYLQDLKKLIYAEDWKVFVDGSVNEKLTDLNERIERIRILIKTKGSKISKLAAFFFWVTERIHNLLGKRRKEK